MKVQTDLRAGTDDGRRKRCKCGWSFYFLNDWEFHVANSNLSGNVIGIGNDHNSYSYEA